MESVISSAIAESKEIASNYLNQMNAQKKEHSNWYYNSDSDLKIAFRSAIEATTSQALTISLSSREIKMIEAIQLRDYLETAEKTCVELTSFYEATDKPKERELTNQFYTLIESPRRIISDLAEKVRISGDPVRQPGDLVMGNITFRHGNMGDPEIFEPSNLIVLPIRVGHIAGKESTALSKKLKFKKPQTAIALGEIAYATLSSDTGRARAGAWVCCRNEGGSSSYGVIEDICEGLMNTATLRKTEFVSLPLLGISGGGLDSREVARVYVQRLTRSGPLLKFIVSIISAEVFLKVSTYLRFNMNLQEKSFVESSESAIPQETSNPPDAPIPPVATSSPQKEEPDIKSRLISDTFTADETDVLQYDVIAQNLFAIMTDKGTTPPLNIGIFAPWGRGKTSLMRMLQGKFDEARAAELKLQNRTPKHLAGWRAVLHWLRNDEIDLNPQLPYATVWFNPWNYQSSDMIWAGMADAVIEQTVAQIPSKTEREVFWMQLRMARLAKEKIRKDIQTRFLLYVLQFIIWGVFIALAIIFLSVNKTIPWGLVGAGSISGLLTSLVSRIHPLSKSISEAFDKYSEAPKYQEKTGTFHEVQADLNKVLDLCIDGTKPLVIFIDDLDRCSPSKVVEVVEAINVFINGRFNTKCYFILGMDGEMVAGALDVCYEKMKGKLGSREIDQGSIGWYFLDKFIQLPYFIPVMSEKKKEEYLSNLLSEKKEVDAKEEGSAPAADMEKVKELAQTVLSTSDIGESSKVIKEAGLSSVEQKELDKQILQNQVESEKQNETIREQVSAYAPFISSDPRSLKRFANLLRFYCAYQFLRMKKGQPYVEAPILAKWLAIMLKFPQLVRWIQWDSENRSGIHSASEEKVKLLDDLLEGFFKNKEDPEFTGWLKYEVPASLSNNGEVFLITQFDDVPWLRSRKLFDILVNEQNVLSSFKNALKCNVW
ncbi:MAG TPA: P-loop NTPase fold protein [Puia sp.]|nr:P-loop NTPase fold protein [Puia sp.]